MSDESTNVEPADSTNGNDSTTAPSNTETPQTPETVPYDRFQKVNKAKTDAENKLKEFEAKAQQEAAELAKKNGEFEKLYNDNLNKIQGYDELNTTIEKILESQLESIPEDKRTLIPTDYTAKQKLDYINANRALLMPNATTKNHPVKQGEQEDGKVYHKASDIKNPEYYDKHRDDIIKAMNEGRIID